MELHEKLQVLRRQRKLTQDELAAALFISRTAVSKWESGRGYPSIDSLKAIAAFYSVTIDELLSSDELLTHAESDRKPPRSHDLSFGLLDLSAVMFFFFPLFGQAANGSIQEVSLLFLTRISPWLRGCYLTTLACITLWGILTLALQNRHLPPWSQHKRRGSLLLHGMAVFLFILSRQPYAAALLFLSLAIKVLILVKQP